MRQVLASQALSAIGLLSLLSISGCLCPPCGPEAEAAVPVAPGSVMVVWNGDDVKGTAQGWGACDQKPNCSFTAGLVENEGVDGSGALRVHAVGGGWVGGGWNWFGWWPENGGTDLSQYDDMTFMVRVVAKENKFLPEPGGLQVGLRCSNGKKSSPMVTLGTRTKNLTDGAWHKISIPLMEFRKGKEGKQFDLKSVWELSFSAWHDSPRDFNLYVDDLSVEKR